MLVLLLMALLMVLVPRVATGPCQMPISSSVASRRRRRKSPSRTGRRARQNTHRQQQLQAAPFHRLHRALPNPHPPPPPPRLHLPHLRQQLPRQPSGTYHKCWSGSSSTLASIFQHYLDAAIVNIARTQSNELTHFSFISLSLYDSSSFAGAFYGPHFRRVLQKGIQGDRTCRCS